MGENLISQMAGKMLFEETWNWGQRRSRGYFKLINKFPEYDTKKLQLSVFARIKTEKKIDEF